MADMVCLPNQYQWQISQEYQPLSNGLGYFDLAEEWYDYNAKNFRWRQKTFTTTGVEVINDILLIGATQKMYTINGTSGSGIITCTVQKAAFPNASPCLQQNATIVGNFFVAGSVFTQVWGETWMNGNYTVYSEISLTAEDNIPIYGRDYITDTGASTELYFNYAINLDSDAFTIPSICPQTADLPGVYPEEELRRRFKWLRRPVQEE